MKKNDHKSSVRRFHQFLVILIGVYLAITLSYLIYLFQIECDGLFGCFGYVFFLLPLDLIFLIIFLVASIKIIKEYQRNKWTQKMEKLVTKNAIALFLFTLIIGFILFLRFGIFTLFN